MWEQRACCALGSLLSQGKLLSHQKHTKPLDALCYEKGSFRPEHSPVLELCQQVPESHWRGRVIIQPQQQKPAHQCSALPFHLSFLHFKNIFLILISGPLSGKFTHTSQGYLQIRKTFITTSEGALSTLLCITEFSCSELSYLDTVAPLCTGTITRRATIFLPHHNGEERAERLFHASGILKDCQSKNLNT